MSNKCQKTTEPFGDIATLALARKSSLDLLDSLDKFGPQARDIWPQKALKVQQLERGRF